MGHLEANAISYQLPDGRQLLDEVTFRVGDGAVVALVGPNGTGKTTLLRILAGDLTPHGGTVGRSGRLGVMRQFIGHGGNEETGDDVRGLLVSLAPQRIRTAARTLEAAELAMMTTDDEPTQMAYAQALSDWGDAGGYEQETLWDVCVDAALGLDFARAQYRSLDTLSGGEQKRLALEALLRGEDDVLVLDEPDNYLDVPGKRWLESRLRETDKTVLLISHDRELLAEAATAMVTLEPTAVGANAWTHSGGFATYHQARADRNSRLEELHRRWDEEHAKLKTLVLTLRSKSEFNDGLASRYQAAQTRLRKFEQAGPPQLLPDQQKVTMRLRGGRTGKRAVVAQRLELTGLMRPFDLEIWFGERVGVLGANGSGKSHFLRLLAAGGTDPDGEHQPVDENPVAPVAHSGSVKLGARVRPGWFVQTHEHPELRGRTLLEVLHRGTAHRPGMGREQAARALDRYELAGASEQTFDSLSGGQQARFQILLLELSGATLLLLDEPTDNLDLHSAEALEAALQSFEGTVLVVTHDRWFARSLDRFVVFSADGEVITSDTPIWDESRVARPR